MRCPARPADCHSRFESFSGIDGQVVRPIRRQEGSGDVTRRDREGVVVADAVGIDILATGEAADTTTAGRGVELAVADAAIVAGDGGERVIVSQRPAELVDGSTRREVGPVTPGDRERVAVLDTPRVDTVTAGETRAAATAATTEVEPLLPLAIIVDEVDNPVCRVEVFCSWRCLLIIVILLWPTLVTDFDILFEILKVFVEFHVPVFCSLLGNVVPVIWRLCHGRYVYRL
jgi:hypothetical protein